VRPSVRRTRRQTGGGAIIHADELTYSLTLPTNHPLLAKGPNYLYTLVHEAAITMLIERGITAAKANCEHPANAQRGPFLCFERRSSMDVVVNGKKVLGSAQRRTAGAVLQHGSLQLGDLVRLDPRHLSPNNLSGPFVNALAQKIGASFTPSKWHEDSLAIAHDLFDKYAGAEWTKQR